MVPAILLLPAASMAEPPPGPYAMWVWDVRHVATDAARGQLVTFCRAQRVSALYLSAYQFSPAQTEHYRAFLRQAHREGIVVHALAGDPRWALNRYHSLPLAWVRQVMAFNDEGPPEERFDGVHTDIEPYLLSRQWMERPAQLIGGLLDLHEKVRDLIHTDPITGVTAPAVRGSQRPLRLGVDVPFWFDDDPTYRIQWRDRVLPPSHHLLDVADYLTVMAYRNYAEGSEGVIELSRRELEYAEQVGKFIVIGQETQPDLFPAYVTYGGSSAAYLRGELEKIAEAYRDRPGFGGFAIHHYESYREFLEKA
ncbi:MAG: hypothetical protein A3C53_01085 [Omnitrophica WOR_2 bacterium RIFCSPHIGHO2_02_FULL_68_15]|nr:MAG: hypothetical protein A3C53_01085 [Omnitrophica WOR_2 bacterium RIFCSPHIGHO2_02_FULL_68_15]